MQVDLKLSLSTIFEIINATDNKEVATQLFEGTYVEPVVPTTVFNTAKKEICTFISFNKWNNKVYFSFPKYKYYNEDRSDFEWKASEKFAIKEFHTIGNDTMDLGDWQSYFNESLEAFVAPKDFVKLAEYATLEDQKVISLPLQD